MLYWHSTPNECQVFIPEGAMAGFGDAVQAMAAPIMQGGTQFRLAGGNAQ
jgi:hypothetical protein